MEGEANSAEKNVTSTFEQLKMRSVESMLKRSDKDKIKPGALRDLYTSESECGNESLTTTRQSLTIRAEIFSRNVGEKGSSVSRLYYRLPFPGLHVPTQIYDTPREQAVYPVLLRGHTCSTASPSLIGKEAFGDLICASLGVSLLLFLQIRRSYHPFSIRQRKPIVVRFRLSNEDGLTSSSARSLLTTPACALTQNKRTALLSVMISEMSRLTS
ncbi:hypothetical protein EVAR_12250_1 [Eumeta japonica]|uniref:Uncharacterized protein n=1 Tax=Eumeta variegata TaxID=151549 RepID=A0A4C1TUF2_EUMVA|nr:hypothetical protein EVAR_12250_1 [Eumeta japonica]